MNTILIISGLGILTLLGEIFKFRKALAPAILIGLVIALGASLLQWQTGTFYYSNMLYFDKFTHIFCVLLCSVGIFWFLFFYQDLQQDEYITEKFSLILFSIVGGLFMVSFNHLVILFLGIEILSIPLYALAASNREDSHSIEAGLKYFLMSSFATGFLLFGIALVYGATGTFYLDQISLNNPSTLSSLLPLGIVLMFMGLSFKVSIVPFHFWTPDVYQGSPTMITSFMSTAVKIVAFAAFFRLVAGIAPVALGGHTWILVVCSVLSILIGNILAVSSVSVKRMLAYSSIAQAGYLFITLFQAKPESHAILVYGLTAYSLASMTLFVIVHILEQNGLADSIQSFNGLGSRHPLLAACCSICLFSLAGIPPVAGFLSKYLIFTQAITGGYLWLVLLAVLTSLIGVYYYFKIVIAMYFQPATSDRPKLSSIVTIGILVLTAGLLLFGLFPDFILRI